MHIHGNRDVKLVSGIAVFRVYMLA